MTRRFMLISSGKFRTFCLDMLISFVPTTGTGMLPALKTPRIETTI